MFKKLELMSVLILVLMEDTLGDVDPNEVYLTIDRLNPCSNGRYPQRSILYYLRAVNQVLILVLMEDALRV